MYKLFSWGTWHNYIYIYIYIYTHTFREFQLMTSIFMIVLYYQIKNIVYIIIYIKLMDGICEMIRLFILYSIYIKRIQKISYYYFFSVKNTPKLINQQYKNGVKIVNWQKKVSYCFFYYQKYPYLKLKNVVKIVNWQK